VWVVHHANGTITSGIFVADVEEGYWTTWYRDGKKARVFPYVHGKGEGTEIEWYETGQRIAVRHYVGGALHGAVDLTYPDGTVVHEEWRNGRRIVPPP
jgi:antitoxin component YwqK of YwqJK toxin-antitoxin module